MEKKKRPRIARKLIGEVVIDETVYVANKSSKNAKKVLEKSEHIEIEIWCDKHYYNRAQLGDEHGKREGIEEDAIKDLMLRSIPHLMYYVLKVPNFNFINFQVATRYTRIVLRDIKKDGILNVVVEFHHKEYNRYEATVITAMQKEDFQISVGQNLIELEGDNSYLKKRNGNNIIDIDTFSK